MNIIKSFILTLLAMTATTASAQQFQEMKYTPQSTTFRLFAPNDAKAVKLRIYDKGQGGKALKTVKMTRTANEQWTATVKGDLM